MGVPARTSMYWPGLQKTEMPKSMALSGESGVLSRNINCSGQEGVAGRIVAKMGGGPAIAAWCPGGRCTDVQDSTARHRCSAQHLPSAEQQQCTGPPHVLRLDVPQHDIHSVALRHRSRHLPNLPRSQAAGQHCSDQLGHQPAGCRQLCAFALQRCTTRQKTRTLTSRCASFSEYEPSLTLQV